MAPVADVPGVVVELLLGVVLELIPPAALPLVEPLSVPELVVLELLGNVELDEVELLGEVELLLVDGEVDEDPIWLEDEEEPGNVLDEVSVDCLLLLELLVEG